MRKNNRIILDLNKVQFGYFHYVNQYGQIVYVQPSRPTVRLQEVFSDKLAMYHPLWPGESEQSRAERLEMIDEWTPVCTFQLTANHNVQYTGEKANTMYKTWNSKIFNKKD